MFRLCLLGLALPRRVLGLVLLDDLPMPKGFCYSGCGVVQDLELSRGVGVVAGMLPGGVRECVPGVAVRMALRLVPAVQFPHWPFARPMLTLGLDIGYGYWVELVQVAILNDFRFERSMTPGREAARPSLTWHPALPTDRNAMAAETTAHHTKTVV